MGPKAISDDCIISKNLGIIYSNIAFKMQIDQETQHPDSNTEQLIGGICNMCSHVESVWKTFGGSQLVYGKDWVD